jgi:hypothetical protein
MNAEWNWYSYFFEGTTKNKANYNRVGLHLRK